MWKKYCLLFSSKPENPLKLTNKLLIIKIILLPIQSNKHFRHVNRNINKINHPVSSFLVIIIDNFQVKKQFGKGIIWKLMVSVRAHGVQIKTRSFT